MSDARNQSESMPPPGRVRRGSRSPSAAPAATQLADVRWRRLARAGGRAVLWAFVALVLLRGVEDIVTTEPAARQASATRQRPGDAVRAFATTLAHEYLDRSRDLRRYLPEDRSVDELPVRGNRTTTVAGATVAGERQLSSNRWIVTVACKLAGGARTRYLAIPVARDSRGALALFALPAVVSGPAVARADPGQAPPVEGPAAEAVEGLVERFLAAYLSGTDRAELRYLTAPGLDVPAVGGLSLVEVQSVGELAKRAGRRRVIAEIRARDRATAAIYPLSYRLVLVRRERWYVAAVEGAVA